MTELSMAHWTVEVPVAPKALFTFVDNSEQECSSKTKSNASNDWEWTEHTLYPDEKSLKYLDI